MGRKKGFKLSEETKRKISLANKGKRKPIGFNVGRKLSEKHKNNIRMSLTGKKLTKEHKNNISLSHKGKHNSPETEFKRGQVPHNKGKSKIYVDEGYLKKRINGKTKRIHRIIMEKYLGRKLKFNEVIHHINGKRNDNRIENLVVLTSSQHLSIHRSGNLQNQINKLKELDLYKEDE